MPKKVNKPWGGRNGRGNMPEEKHYFGHDDRGGRIGGSHLGGTKPRVSFKTNINRDIRRNLALSSLNDDDIPMTGNSNNNSRQVIVRDARDNKNWQRRIMQGRNSPLPNRNFGKGGPSGSRLRQFTLQECNWYRVSIPYGHKYEKEYVLRSIMNYMAGEALIPITYKISASEASFYLDDYKVAFALQNCDRKITMNDGFKLQIRVKPSNPSFINEIDEKLKDRLKQAMSKRYVQETKALNLSKFHQDSDLVNEYFYALFRTPLLMAVLDIVSQHIPDLEALNLEGNKLYNIDKLNILNKKFPKLKILYLSENKIMGIHQLDAIKDLKLDELKLSGNPACYKYKNRQNDYISDVRKRFPKLLRLDGIDLPRPIVFDVADEAAKVPSSQRMFVADTKAQEIASQFLQQYFAIFDRENRQPLLDAYNEHACFSMTITPTHANKLNGYLVESRNLLRITETIRRQKLLKQGKLPIVSFISQMPQTRHFVDTFTMDIALAMQAMMFITITGYFQEINTKEQPIRHFNRTFIIVPEGSGYCICNEQLHISQPSEAQLKQLHQQLNSAQLPQAQPQAPALLQQQLPTETEKPTAITSELNENIKQQMTVTLSQQTNMNLEWSLKCLQETNWNYDNALSAFQEFFKRGQIPPEAFAK